jgi:hypothetical protein
MTEEASQAPVARACSRCRASAKWLVTVRYNDYRPAGRLLVYCDACRKDLSNNVGTALPISLLDEDPNTILSLLYRHNATATDPTAVAEVIGVEVGPWVEVARQQIEQSTT